MVAHIKKIFSKEQVQELPFTDDLHLSGIFAGYEIAALDNVCVTRDVTGNIYCAKNIIVCKDVKVTGNINCKKCTLEGVIQGNISASETIDIKAGGILNGNILTKNLNVSCSAVLNGCVNIISTKEGRQIYADSKLAIDKVKVLNKQGKVAVFEIQPENIQPAEVVGLAGPIKPNPNIKISGIEIIPQKPKRVVIEENNDRW